MKKFKSERGQSLVELAISLVVILWLLAGAVEFGIAFFQLIQLRDAAQEGALYGSLNPLDTTGIQARTLQASSSPINLLNDPNVVKPISITYPDGQCVEGSVRVSITYNHKIFMPFGTLFTGGNKTITIKGEVEDTILNSTAPGCP